MPEPRAAPLPLVHGQPLDRGLVAPGAVLVGLDLRGLDLSAADLEDADLRGVDLRGGKLHGARLRGARLDGARLDEVGAHDVDLEGASLVGASLARAELDGAILLESDLRRASLDGARLVRADLRGALLEEAVLAGADLALADLAAAHLAGAHLAGARLRRTHLSEVKGLTDEARRALVEAGGWEGAVAPELAPVVALAGRLLRPASRWAQGRAVRLRADARAWVASREEARRAQRAEQRRARDPLAALEARLGRPAGPGADLSGLALTGLRLRAVDWRGVELRAARLQDADLRGADLTGATLAQATLVGAALDAAVLADADLTGADLSGASLVDADLRGARLDGAILDQCDLSGADLTGASADQADLRGVLGLDAAGREALRGAATAPTPVAKPIPRAAPEPARAARPGLLDVGRRAWQARRAAGEERRERALRARREALPGGPGADLSGQDLSGRHLEGVDWTEARLEGTRLDGAHLQEARLTRAQAPRADLTGARLLGADLSGLVAQRARLVDADLRRADLRGADLREADLTGADLRDARLAGARLAGADLTAARLPDADLEGVDLEGATLDQADLTGADLRGARVTGADLRGALGLSSAQRAALTQAGARVTDASLRELASRIRPRHAAAAAAIIALGLGSYGAARLLGPGAGAASTAAELRALPPAEALARFEELADAAEVPQDKVAWLLEAAGQARRLGDEAAQERLLRQALAASGEDVAVGGEVRLALATLLAAGQAHEEAMALIDPLLDQSRQTAEQRARAVLLYQELGEARGVDTAPRVQAVLDGLSALPDAAAELRLALASALAARGEVDAALDQIARCEALAVSAGTRARVLETRARVLDRGYRLDEAEQAWLALAAQTVPDTAAHQGALLALADLRARMGRQDEALAGLEALVGDDVDPRVRMRAWMVRAGIEEARGTLPQAARSLQRAIDLGAVDPEMAEEARLSLARLFGADDDAQLAGMLEGLDPQARALIEVQAGLGQARARLEAGRPDQARTLYEELLAREELDPVSRRDARIGLGEAWAQEGDLARALAEWRDLLSETARAEDRAHLQLRIAEGLLSGGRLDEAVGAWEELTASADPEVASQGRLGLARCHLALGERERARQALQEVADSATDPAWKVRALEELADLVSEEGDTEATLAAWRRVLAQSPPGHAAAGRARLAMVHTLSAAGRVEEGRRACRAAIDEAATPPERLQATLTCAELDERAGDLPAALGRYAGALEAATGGPDDLRLDAAMGVARLATELGRPQAALDATTQGIPLATEGTQRLELLDLQVRALEALGLDSVAAVSARDALLAQEPEAAVGMWIAAAQEARARGDLEEARRRMAQAAQAATDPVPRAGALLELADLHLEAGDAQAADAAWRGARDALPDDPAVSFQAGMGQAELLRRAGDPRAAAASLAALSPPDPEGARWLAEARARALVEAGDPGALAAWEALAALSAGDGEARATALRGQADAHFAADRFDRALPLYEEAGAATREPALSGWCALGATEARAALGQEGVDASFLRLTRHPDPEVAAQAAVRRSQRAAEQEDWEGALAALQGLDGQSLGVGWDATVTQARASALAGAGRDTEAEGALADLAGRWPTEEEAQVSAALGRAGLARTRGDLVAAEAWARKALESSSDPGFQALAQAQLDEIGAESDEP